MHVTTALVVNLVLVLVFVLAAINGIRQGFLAGLFRLAGTVLGVLGAVWAARTLAPKIYESWLGVAIGEKVNAAIAGQGASASAVIEQYVGFLPDSIKNSLTLSLQIAANSGSTSIAQQVVDALQPLLMPLLQALLFLVAVLVIRLVFRLLISLLRHVNQIPLLGSLNKILGFCFGVVTGTLDCWLLCILLWLATSVSTGSLPWLTATQLDASVLYRFFNNFNPFITH